MALKPCEQRVSEATDTSEGLEADYTTKGQYWANLQPSQSTSTEGLRRLYRFNCFKQA
jgi:hypothetical protein